MQDLPLSDGPGRHAAAAPWLAAAALDALPVAVALADGEGRLVLANPAWRERGAAGGPWSAPVGTDYLRWCDAGAPGVHGLPQLAAQLRAVLAGAAPTGSAELAGDTPAGMRSVVLRITPFACPDGRGALLTQDDVTDRRRLARDLARTALQGESSNRLLETMLSTTPDLTCAVDAGGRLIHANGPLLRLWGRRLEQVRGRTVAEMDLPPELACLLPAPIEQVFLTAQPVRGEMPLRAPDGTPRQYEYVFSPAFGPDGQVDLAIGCMRDVTAARRAEQALRHSIAEFRALSSAMPQIVWVLDAAGRCGYLNQRWVEFTGMGVTQSLGEGWLRAVHPQDWVKLARYRGGPCDAEEHAPVELRLAGADGAWRWWLVRGVALRDDAGRVLKWVGTCTDVQVLKDAEAQVIRANEELSRQRHELRTLLDLVPAMLWLKDERGRILSINRRAAASAGLEVEQAVGRTMAELFPAEAEEYLAEDEEIARTSVPLLNVVERQQVPDGPVRWYRRDKVPCLDSQGRMIGMVVMKRDITEDMRNQEALRQLNASLEARVRERTAELAQARDDAERANRAKSAFLAAMGHEIRTPMSGLLGLLELLELTPLGEEQRSTLRVARDSGQALTQIIDGLLDFARIESDSLSLSPAPGSVRALAERIRRLHAPVAATKGLALDLCLGDFGSLHRFDDLRLGQVLNNFVSNAVKFTAQGSVTLQVERAAVAPGRERLEFTVRDTGIGIAPAALETLFRPFARADAQIARRYGGTGLGLFIAKRLSELMGGEVRVHSVPGQGTAITLAAWLELCEEGSMPEVSDDTVFRQLQALVANRPPRPSIAQAEAEGTLLLVVDDHPVNRMLLLRQVSALGYAAEAASDGTHALHAWRSGRFAAIITDCSMPEMDGYELARRVRAGEEGAGRGRIPIIGCTADASPAARRACAEAGMDAAVIKPVALRELSAFLDRFVPVFTPPEDDWEDTDRYETVHPGVGEPVDMRVVGQMARGDAEGAAEVLQAFRAGNAEDAAQLRLAVRALDHAGVLRLAHRMRGACAMVGAAPLANACQALHEAAAARDAVLLRACLADFERAYARLEAGLAASLSSR